MEHPLQRLWNKPERLVIGFMSGTSADGVDAALVRISGYGVETRLTQLAFCFTPFDEATRAEVLRLAGGGSAAAADFCRINFHLGQLYCEAGDALCRQAGIERAQVDLIGCHGQTLWHIPQEEIYLGRSQHSTFQLGESAMLAEHFGCPTVGDFRVRDVAAGGLGAPLVPYTEFLLYRSREECVALQNIGGIGNVTVLPRDCRLEDVFAFDTGPGNMLMDALVERLTNGRQHYDAGGKMAAQGRVDAGIFDAGSIFAAKAAQNHRPRSLWRAVSGGAAGLRCGAWRIAAGYAGNRHPLYGGVHCLWPAALQPLSSGTHDCGRRRML